MRINQATTSFLIATCLAVAGCAADGETEVGTVEMAIVAPGGGGAIYRLPAGTSLLLASSSFFGGASLDGDETSVTVSVPPGTYNAWLRHDDYPGTAWRLDREIGGSVEEVNATLTTPVPVSVEVVAGTTTSLTFSFTVAGGGIVTFEQGEIVVDVEVTETTSTSGDLDWTGGPLTTTFAAFDPAAPAALSSRLPDLGTTGLDITIAGHVDGEWVQTGFNEACATFTPTSVHSGSTVGFTDMLAESTAQGELCIMDSSVVLSFQRTGAPVNETFSDIGSETMSFSTRIVADLPGPQPFDAATHTLDLGLFAGTRTLSTMVRTDVVDATTAPWTTWYTGLHEGTLTLTFLPAE